ncbi:2-keto-3-deoxy-D-arabino-heptulosonate-7-phosphate synthase I alpha [hydrothermal vent metagenome]|uniref:3-deoxy-7-phosphoheptulonate synthase n=1 Tax=hydrothermal vent metagenome TaxID=652676 RepID=A0A3B1BDX8_9ZZZZ
MKAGFGLQYVAMNMKYKTDDLRITALKEVIPSVQLHQECPITETASRLIFDTRTAIHNILRGKDDRLLVIVGPCSVHDPKAAMEYAEKLQLLKKELADDLLIVMRVYFEKPRTTVGWKGLINDPDLDESFQINKGLRMARKLLLDINNAGVPAATEFLDLITPQYVTDLISWGAIGARTTESQVHRELASGLSCPVGFKNSTDGTLQVAIDAIGATARPHNFLSVTKAGNSAIFATTGNDDCHIILRGGRQPNYDADSVHKAGEELAKAGLEPVIMVDFSHANSQKDYHRQVAVGRDVAEQIAAGNRQIIGVMIESHLLEGRQNKTADQDLVYGQSITDACLGWDVSETLLRDLAIAVQTRRVV